MKTEKHLVLRSLIVYVGSSLFIPLFWFFILGLGNISYDEALGFGLALLVIVAFALFIAMVIFSQEQERLYSIIGEGETRYQYKVFERIDNDFKGHRENNVSLRKQVSEINQKILKIESVTKKQKLYLEKLIQQHEALDVQKKSEESFFNALLEVLPVQIWILDANGDLRALKSGPNDLILNANQIEILRKKDFSKIVLTLNGEKQHARTKRIFEEGVLTHVLLVCEAVKEIEALKSVYLKKSKEIHLLYEMSLIVSGRNSIGRVLNDSIEKMASIYYLKDVVIRLYEPDRGLVIKASSGGKSKNLTEVKSVTKTHAGFAFLNNQMVVLNQPSDAFMPDHDAKALLDEGSKLVYVPLASDEKRLGIMSVISEEEVDSEASKLFAAVAIHITVALERILLYEELKNNYFKTVEAFVTAAEIKSERFSGHSRRIAELCKIIAEKLYLSPAEVDDIYIAGLLHDVGKLAFSDHSPEYYVDIHTHGHLGRQMIEKVGLSKEILDGIEFHHMDYQQKRPHQRDTVEQPYYAQIIKIANDLDMFFTYSTKQEFRETFYKEMLPHSGKLYAPNFLSILKTLFDSPENPIFAVYDNEGKNETK